MEQLHPHPALALIPSLSDVEYAELRDDIEANGQRVPIYYRDWIFDGRGRERACIELGIKPRYEKVAAGVEPIGLVISLNLRRRQLAGGAGAIIIAQMLRLGRGRQIRGSADLTASQASHLTGTSQRKLEAAKVVVQKGTAELVAAVKSGAIATFTAAEISKHTPERQREIVTQAAKSDRRGTALALARSSSTSTRAAIGQRLTDSDLEALRALALFGKTGTPQVRAGVKVLQRIVPAVSR